jgi:hypothetical protein
MTNAEASTTEHSAAVAPQGANVAPTKPASKKAASRKKGAPKGQKAATGSKAKPARKKARATKPAKAAAKTPRAESKGARILALICRSKGATLAEIQKATGWQAHSVRGFLSTAAKKFGRKIESARNEAGTRMYQIKK